MITDNTEPIEDQVWKDIKTAYVVYNEELRVGLVAIETALPQERRGMMKMLKTCIDNWGSAVVNLLTYTDGKDPEMFCPRAQVGMCPHGLRELKRG